jgi:hypothetical protein
MLTIASLLSILLTTFHLGDDIIRGMEKGGVSTLVAVPILVVWLYGTLVLAERRSGYVIILIGSLLGLAVPVIHMMGKGVGVGGVGNANEASTGLQTRLRLHRLFRPGPHRSMKCRDCRMLFARRKSREVSPAAA